MSLLRGEARLLEELAAAGLGVLQPGLSDSERSKFVGAVRTLQARLVHRDGGDHAA